MVVVTRKEGKNKKKKETAAVADAKSKSPSETLNPSIEKDKEEN